MFDACYYINLDSNPGRREAFERRVRSVKDWPFPKPQRWTGVQEHAPPFWKTGDGAWGCFAAHVNLLHHCIIHGIESVVVFEDDAVFVDDFAERVRDFMSAVPDDWHQIHFGGNHCKSPTVHNDKVLRSRGCNCTWAYAVRGAGLSCIHELVGRFPKALHDENSHIDVMFSMLQHAEQMKAYAPWRWLCGQAAGRSDRCGYEWEKDEWFHLPEETLAKAKREYDALQRLDSGVHARAGQAG